MNVYFCFQSVKESNPQWNLLNIKEIDRLLTIQWKLFNAQRIPHAGYKLAVQKLKEVLDL